MIYFDNAATSFPKPESVYKALNEGARIYGGNPSRGGHFLSLKSSNELYKCRESLASFFSSEAENIAFTLNATYALNTAIKGIARNGGRFIISDIEHNAVLRPMYALKEAGKCDFDIARVVGRSDDEIINEIASLMCESTIAVVMTHASNLCSFRLPIRKIGAFCKKKGICFILDASQSAGHTPISMKDDMINILCAPAHKGLYGIMGLGFLISDGRFEIKSFADGGSGYNSASHRMPDEMPEHLEAGTLPLPAICALRAGIHEIEKCGFGYIEKHERELFSLMRNRLSKLPRVKIYLPEYEGSVLLFNIDGVSVNQADSYLSDSGICIRSGFHCCPLGHNSLSTGDCGALRVSFGINNTCREVNEFCDKIAKICKK